jgi:hypothetical protein
MMTTVASLLMLTSPVRIPTSSPNFYLKSLNFWLESALMGDVYIVFVMCFIESAIAYSATTVFPADVCAATNTHPPYSNLWIALF